MQSGKVHSDQGTVRVTLGTVQCELPVFRTDLNGSSMNFFLGGCCPAEVPLRTVRELTFDILADFLYLFFTSRGYRKSTINVKIYSRLAVNGTDMDSNPVSRPNHEIQKTMLSIQCCGSCLSLSCGSGSYLSLRCGSGSDFQFDPDPDPDP